MLRLSNAIDRLLAILKWPAAIVAVLLLPRAALALLAVLRVVLAEPPKVLPLLAGFAGYLVLWRLILRHRPFGHFFSTLEHELTHALFALATFHRVSGLKATFRRGGHMTYHGLGNWLVTIAPYFFPTAALLVLGVSAFLDERWLGWAGGVLGVALAYHVTSTFEETHSGQTDLKEVGWIFALAFLPAANVIAIGAILSFATGGGKLLTAFAKDLWV
jgi:hypothetical protein